MYELNEKKCVPVRYAFFGYYGGFVLCGMPKYVFSITYFCVESIVRK